MDRSKLGSSDLSLYKLLDIRNFGVYYKTKEKNILSSKSADQIGAEMKALSKIDLETGKLSECADFYLIEPILLQIKLVQNEIVEALDKLLPHYILNV